MNKERKDLALALVSIFSGINGTLMKLRIVVVLWIFIAVNEITTNANEKSWDFNKYLPQILSPKLRLTVTKGDTILLPCKVTNLGDNQVFWRHNNNILVGNQIMPVDERIRMFADFTLEFSRLSYEDEGSYSCVISSWPSLNLTHTVSIIDPPTLTLFPKEGIITVNETEDVLIGCIPKGTPYPKITWSKRDGAIPLVGNFVNKTRIKLEKVSRMHSGLYVCELNNGAGRPAIGGVLVRVLHAPQVIIPKNIIYGGVGFKNKLTCITLSDPLANITWTNGNSEVQISNRIFTEVSGTEFSLIFNWVLEEDFGTYYCIASNAYGIDRNHIEFTGKPKAPIVNRWDSTLQNETLFSVTLFWSVESNSPLIDFVLYFRPGKKGENRTKIELTIPADPSTAFIHTKAYTFHGLTNDSLYEASLKARNKFGRGPLSELYYFFPNSSKSTTLKKKSVINPFYDSFPKELNSTSVQTQTDFSSFAIERHSLNFAKYFIFYLLLKTIIEANT